MHRRRSSAGDSAVFSQVISLDTEGSGVRDTELGLWDANGALLSNNDDVLDLRCDSNDLPFGTYYVAGGAYNSFFGDNFDMSGPANSDRTLNLRRGALLSCAGRPRLRKHCKRVHLVHPVAEPGAIR